jgi:hypothetical protein
MIFSLFDFFNSHKFSYDWLDFCGPPDSCASNFKEPIPGFWLVATQAGNFFFLNRGIGYRYPVCFLNLKFLPFILF